MGKIRTALVGCGGVVRRYRKAYARMPGVEVVAAIDQHLDEAEAAARETGAARFSDRFEDALEPGVDAVVISTPNSLHREHAVAALRAGKHVLLQKPMARSVEECEAILEAQRGAGVLLGIYMNLLDHPLFRDIRRMLAEGYLGRIALYSARLAHRGGLSWPGVEKNWRASREATGGGSFVQLGVHYQHLMRWLLGQQVARVQAFSRNIACPHLEGDDMTLAQYELDGGALGDIQTGWCAQEEHVSLLGTKGSIHYRENRIVEYVGEGGAFEGEALHLSGGGGAESVECLPPEWDDAANPYNQHRRFFETVAAGATPEVTGEDGREDVRIVQACYQAAACGKAIDV